jgi:hypothetical protein
VSWSSALGDFAAVLAEQERRLAEDAWDGEVAVWTPPAISGQPDAADRAEAELLLARAAQLEERLHAELEATRAALDELARRRVAAAAYGGESRSIAGACVPKH